MSSPLTSDASLNALPAVTSPDLQPNVDNLVTEDGTPVDSIYSEKQMRLLTAPLYDSWSKTIHPGTFLATANVGMFYSDEEPPLVPDVLLSLDVKAPDDLGPKKNRSYFFWKYGKAPEAVIEIVSNQIGGELSFKKTLYARIGILYYIVWDPLHFLGSENLQCFLLAEKVFKKNGPWFPAIGLGVKEWEGTFENISATWLRWCDEQGRFILTGGERAEQENSRAEEERSRADKLADQLRALGIDPNQK